MYTSCYFEGLDLRLDEVKVSIDEAFEGFGKFVSLSNYVVDVVVDDGNAKILGIHPFVFLYCVLLMLE